MTMLTPTKLVAAAVTGLLTLALMAPSAAAADRIAFVRIKPSESKIITMEANGKKQRTVMKHAGSPDNRAWAAQLSPDGSRLLFVGGSLGPGKAYIGVAKANGKGVKRIIKAKKQRNISVPSWHPDGDRIIYAEVTQTGKGWIKTARADGKQQKVVRSFNMFVAFPSWSPDGQRIVFIRNIGFSRLRMSTMKPNGKGLRNIGKKTGAAIPGGYSPDGKRIVFTWRPDPPTRSVLSGAIDGTADITRRGIGGSPDLYTMKANGKGVKRLSDDEDIFGRPAYSSDGKRIFASRWAPSGMTESVDLFSLPAKGGKWKRLTKTEETYNVFDMLLF